MAHVRLMSTAYGAPWTGIQGTGVTATGIDLKAHPKQYVVAVDPSVIPLGSKLKIPENPFGDPNIVFTAADTGGAIKGRRLDFYDWRGRQAQMNWGTRSIVAHIVGKGDPRSAARPGGAQGPAGGPQVTFSPGQSTSDLNQQPAGADIATLVQQLMTPQRAIGAGGYLQDPSFTARASLALPQSYQRILSYGGPAPRANPADAIRQLLPALQGAPMPADAQPTTTITAGGAGGGRAASPGLGIRGGRVIVAPGANRAGVGIAPIVTKFVSDISGLHRTPITIGTGTNHNRMTVDGNVSDHWDGHAADLPVPIDSRRGDAIAMRALELAGVGNQQAAQMARKGGLYTLNPTAGPFAGRRIQVIWKTYQGGDHHNHVHVGIR